jgi:hypothetical protein
MAVGGLGPDALRQNPAGLSSTSVFQFAASHRTWQYGLQQEWLGARFRAGSTWLGLDASAVHAGALEGFDDLGAPTGSFQPLEISVGLGAARRVLPFLDAGVALHGLSLSGTSSALRGWSADCGLVFPVAAHRFGVALRHLGPAVTGELGEYRLPAELAIGGTHRLPAGLDASWTGILEREGARAFRGGMRWRPVGTLALLAGGRWSTHEARVQPGAGVELDWASLRLSYGIVPEEETGTTHHLAIAFRGGASQEAFPRAAAQTPTQAPTPALASEPPAPPAAATSPAPTTSPAATTPPAASGTSEAWSVWGGTHRTEESAAAEARAWKAAGVSGVDLVLLPDGNVRVRLRRALPRGEALRLAQAWGAHAASDLP